MTVRVVALTTGAMSPMTLWTLRRLARSGHEVVVVWASGATSVGPRTRFRRLAKEHGLLPTVSRTAGSLVLARADDRATAPLVDALYGAPALAAWWGASPAARPVPVHEVDGTLNREGAREVLASLGADLLVRVSGGILSSATYTLARHGTINLHHGLAPAVRGMWSIPWGLVEGRPDWIGATVHQIDEGIDTGAVYRRVAPQIAPGDTADTLQFRTHVLAVDALAEVIDHFAAHDGPPPALSSGGPSAYRTAPGVGTWARYLLTGRGRRSRVALERALR
jgi:hypothetical protein